MACPTVKEPASGKNINREARERVALWHQNWANPGRDPGATDRAIHCRLRVGPCDVIMLDTRSERNPAATSDTFLGALQTQWFDQQLKSCRGPFLIVTGGTMWSDTISNGKDSWGVVDPAARERVFARLAQTRLAVLLLSGDRHGARVIRIPWRGGFKFLEFELGSLGAHPGPAAMGKDHSDQLLGIVNTPLFGEFSFAGSNSNPAVTARVLDENGNERFARTWRHDELVPPPATGTPRP